MHSCGQLRLTSASVVGSFSLETRESIYGYSEKHVSFVRYNNVSVVRIRHFTAVSLHTFAMSL